MDDEYHYFAGVDTSHGGAARTKLGKSRFSGDDFSIATGRAKLSGPVELVDLYRASAITDDQMSCIVHKKNQAFRYDMIVMDPAGGGLGVRDKLREPVQNTGAEIFDVAPIINLDDQQMAGVGQAKLVLFGRSDTRIKGIKNDSNYPGVGFTLVSESHLPNKAHELLRGAFEASPPRIKCPARWPGWNSVNFVDADQMRDHLNDATLAGRDKASAEIDLALAQLSQVDRLMQPDMKNVFTDKFGFYSFQSSQKKDAAYSILYMFFSVWLWRQEQEVFNRTKPKGGYFVASVADVCEEQAGVGLVDNQTDIAADAHRPEVLILRLVQLVEARAGAGGIHLQVKGRGFDGLPGEAVQ